jgi:hypothetical protein
MAILSKLSSVRVRLLSKQLILHLLSTATQQPDTTTTMTSTIQYQKLEYDKLHKYATSTRTTFTDNDLKAILNTLHFIIYNSTRFQVPNDILKLELEQLGLPSDIAQSLSKMYYTYQNQLQSHLSSQTLKLNSVTNFQWKINYILDSSLHTPPTPQQNEINTSNKKQQQQQQQQQHGPVLEARLVFDINHHLNNNSKQQLIFDASMQNVDLLLSQLQECQNIMNQVQPTSSP